jgi:predicted nucleic acid-binding protein
MRNRNPTPRVARSDLEALRIEPVEPAQRPATTWHRFSRSSEAIPANRRVSMAELRGRFSVPDPLPAVDGLLAATALVHDLTPVTRNVRDVEATGVKLLNPFR